MRVLEEDFYDRPVVEVARDMVGCELRHGDCRGIIVETEAYHQSEGACHAYVGLTARTSVLFKAPGTAYVYRSYGIHAMLNAVCEPEGVGAAVLVRAVEPLEGQDGMRARRGVDKETNLCSGPGKLCQAFGIWLDLNDTSLQAGPILIGERPPGWEDPEIAVGTRIGITRAVELPWRFCAARSAHVSSPRPPAMRRGRRAA